MSHKTLPWIATALIAGGFSALPAAHLCLASLGSRSMDTLLAMRVGACDAAEDTGKCCSESRYTSCTARPQLRCKIVAENTLVCISGEEFVGACTEAQCETNAETSPKTSCYTKKYSEVKVDVCIADGTQTHCRVNPNEEFAVGLYCTYTRIEAGEEGDASITACLCSTGSTLCAPPAGAELCSVPAK